MHTVSWLGNLKKREHVEDLGTVGDNIKEDLSEAVWDVMERIYVAGNECK